MKSFLFLLLLFFVASIYGQEKKEALILIDIQDFYFDSGAVELVDPITAAENAKQLLTYFRSEGKLVVHVRHNFEPGGKIHDLVAPIDGEKIFSKDEVNAYLGTDLHEYLQENGIEKLILCGMQTHMCLEAATRAGHDLGYECVVVGDACATRDLLFGEEIIKARDVHLSTLSTLKSYAKIIDTKSLTGD